MCSHKQIGVRSLRWGGLSWTAAIAVLMSAIAPMGTLDAAEWDRTAKFDIAAQALDTALLEFSKQAGIQVLATTETVAGKVTNGVKGELVVERALDELLKGSGLGYRQTGSHGVTVELIGQKETASMVPALRFAQSAASANADEQDRKTPSTSAPIGGEKARVEEILVTATKRSENVMDVPLSLSVVSAEDIDRRGMVGAEDYLRGIPSVNQVDGGARYGQAIVIRGIETTTTFQNFYSGATTATYFGETPTTGSAGLLGSNVDIKLVDIERVEVLRGPQGTAFGSASMGGAVRTIPVAPKLDRFEGRLGAGFSMTSGTGGDNNNVQAVFNVPLVKDRFALRAVGYRYDESGFYRNRAGSDAAFRAVIAPYGAQALAFAVDENEVGAARFIGGRIAALFQASERLKFTLSYLTQKTETDGFPLANSGTYDQTVLQVADIHQVRGQTVMDTNIDIANAVMELDLGWADLLATYSYVDGETRAASPYTGQDVKWPASIGFRPPTFHRGHVGEVRLATRLDGAWNFLVGLYGDKSEEAYQWDFFWFGDPATNFLAPGLQAVGNYLDRRDIEQKAAFGEASWEFAPGLTLTGGVRAFEYDRILRINESGALFGGGRATNNDTTASGASFRANLSYKPTEDAMFYAGWSQGFRLGKPDPGVPAALCDRDSDGLIDGTGITLASTTKIDSDEVDNYEIGGKLALFDRRVRLDAAVFRMEWSDIPVLVTHPSCNYGYLTNAGAALSEGVELQANFYLTEALRVDVGGSWINARLTTDVPAQGFRAGDDLPGAPKSNANLGVQQGLRIAGYEAYLRADAIYVGSFYGNVQQTPNSKAGGYVKLDATARLAIRDVNIDLYVRNLTNEDDFTFRGASLTTGLLYGFRPRPRTIGLQIGYNF